MAINTDTSKDEMTDEIPLDTPVQTQEEDDEVDALLDELKEPTQQEAAVQKLKESTLKLGSALQNVSTDIDSKLGVSQKARNVDTNLGISATVGSFLGKLQIRQRAYDVANSEAVKSISDTVNDTLEKTGVKSAVVDGTQKIKSLDDEHKISSSTADVIAGGVEWVANGLNSVVGKSKDQED
mmetsp:Transcript_15683/g.19902  ORF Transcript_15683/g.19902 Transcript_15683/m.19902 type:complete len:182 (-) Transcript_15683:171-716(-)|eukprot:CAMPEP_0203640970 /NCGR_PEP_ID=MMETSP0088-20131115/6330_1 /ASSEMBLY_ACC=CAM_ASM_001087 /TAXON_ID=426623 /ORGANISM="Chaetoceros affinis, Strain CCMP159" /LENGTH=181 /DNA_ID=CAMNT_0050496303 /DNA_START=65 /DNA_END=610 /DNA_ORIENTATION=+